MILTSPICTFKCFPKSPSSDTNTTSPAVAEIIFVPKFAAISVPVCAPDLMLLTWPNLDVIFPFTGVTANKIPLIIGFLVFSSCFINALTFSSTLASATCTDSYVTSFIFSV
mgnify:CR=1 FL=1